MWGGGGRGVCVCVGGGGGGLGGWVFFQCFFKPNLWCSLCTLCLLACQVRDAVEAIRVFYLSCMVSRQYQEQGGGAGPS